MHGVWLQLIKELNAAGVAEALRGKLMIWLAKVLRLPGDQETGKASSAVTMKAFVLLKLLCESCKSPGSHVGAM